MSSSGINLRFSDLQSTFTHRGRFEIIYDILSKSLKPTQKTRILYSCNLSFSQLQKYLKYLESNNLLKTIYYNGKLTYQATDKGKEFVYDYEVLSKFLNNDTKI